MTLLTHYRMFGGYNAWANARLYDAAATLTDEQYRADRGAFFKSVNGTLNHLLVTDRIWMQRFTGTGTAPDRLDTILFETFGELRTAREAEDRRIVDYVDSLDDARIAGTHLDAFDPDFFFQRILDVVIRQIEHAGCGDGDGQRHLDDERAHG